MEEEILKLEETIYGAISNLKITEKKNYNFSIQPKQTDKDRYAYSDNFFIFCNTLYTLLHGIASLKRYGEKYSDRIDCIYDKTGSLVCPPMYNNDNNEDVCENNIKEIVSKIEELIEELKK
jgi:hypothetical protein